MLKGYEKHILKRKKKKSLEPDSDIVHILEVLDTEFKITIINTLSALQKKIVTCKHRWLISAFKMKL